MERFSRCFGMVENRAGDLVRRHPVLSDRGAALLFFVVSACVVVPCTMLFRGYVKDDAYIVFRYARNLIEGHGLVFNPGERVEGYTDFLWVLLASLVAPFDRGDGNSMLVVSRVVSLLSATGLSVATMRIVWMLSANRGPLTLAVATLCGVLVASHPSVAVWTMSGIEAVPFAALVAWSVERTVAGRYRAAFWLALVTSLLRPEGMLLFGFVCLFQFLSLASAVSFRQALGRVVRDGIAPLAFLLAYHIGRISWFGSVLPNTFRVKSSSGHALYTGFEAVVEAVSVGAGELMILAGLFSLLIIRRRTTVLMVAYALVFPIYLWWVGGDEMRFGRLIIAAWPLFAASGGMAVTFLAGEFRGRPVLRSTLLILAAIIVSSGIVANIRDQIRLVPELASYRVRMDSSQRTLGRYLDKRLPDGATVAYQDMGLCPWSAPDLRFIDLIGLVSKEVTDLRDKYGVRLSGEEAADRGAANTARNTFNRGVRDIVFGRPADAIVLQAVLPQDRAADIMAGFRGMDAGSVLQYCNTSYSVGLASDSRLMESYHLDAIFPREPSTLYVVFVRNSVSD